MPAPVFPWRLDEALSAASEEFKMGCYRVSPLS